MDSISRSKNKLERGEFQRIVSLMRVQDWLESKSEAIERMLDLCDNLEEQILLTELLHRFSYIKGSQFSEQIQLMADRLIGDWDLDPKTTVIAALHNDSTADSAQMVLQSLKSRFANAEGWEESNFVNSMPVAVNSKLRAGYSLILVDEFIGTGYQSKRLLKKCREYIGNKALSEITLSLYTIAGMRFSRDDLSKLTDKYEANIWLDKGISDYYKDLELQDARDNMMKIESRLASSCKGRKLPNFGKGGSEALYGNELGNVPVNVFPIFWWQCLKNGQKHETVLSRL